MLLTVFLTKMICIANYFYKFISMYTIQVTPWGFSSEEIKLFPYDTLLNMDLYEENGEWEILDAEIFNFTRFQKTFLKI